MSKMASRDDNLSANIQSWEGDVGNNPSGALIHAAGGIVCGVGDNTGKIALVRRRRYDGEIALPKGKLQTGEDTRDAAVREVGEETGYKVKIRDYAGTTHYSVGSASKEVTYFFMETDGGDHGGPEDTDEIASVEWVTPRDAVNLLTHREDRELISTVFKIEPKGST